MKTGRIERGVWEENVVTGEATVSHVCRVSADFGGKERVLVGPGRS